MEASIHRFARLLRGAGVRVSVSEVIDGIRGAGAPGVIADREIFRETLRSALVKDNRDSERFDELFDAFFALVRFGDERGRSGRSATDAGEGDELEEFDVADELGQSPPENRSTDGESPFDEDSRTEQAGPRADEQEFVFEDDTYDEITFAQAEDGTVAGGDLQLDLEKMHGISPGQLSKAQGTPLDAELSLEQQDALLGWLDDPDGSAAGPRGDEDDAEALRARMSGVLADLPDALRKHLQYLLTLEQTVSADGMRVARVDTVGQGERDQLEESLRRLAYSLRGAPTHRKREAARGRVDSARTMRRNMRYDGVPFRPITVGKAEDKPRLVVLTDVSLSVRATARFTLHLVHGLQERFRSVRTFGFCAEVAEVTDLFARYHVDYALGMIFGGDVLDVDANSDYGTVFGQFVEEYGQAVTRRTTVLVLGDGRGNGNDPNLPAFEDLTRQARETIWLTPEPSYSWALGPCDLPAYAEHCDRVRVVRDLSSLDHAADELAVQLTGR
jgi:uncharacterized protein with von Willebrand factor type A (vWA) domain